MVIWLATFGLSYDFNLVNPKNRMTRNWKYSLNVPKLFDEQFGKKYDGNLARYS